MIFAHTYKWILDKSPHTGKRKSQTRRTAKSLTPRYRVGKTYAIQPGRGKLAVGRIRILSARLHVLEDISDADVRAEGFANREEFLKAYQNINAHQYGRVCWAYEFELVKGE